MLPITHITHGSTGDGDQDSCRVRFNLVQFSRLHCSGEPTRIRNPRDVVQDDLILGNVNDSSCVVVRNGTDENRVSSPDGGENSSSFLGEGLLSSADSFHLRTLSEV